MRFSLEWLREFVATDLAPEPLAARLTGSGFAVEGIEPFASTAGPEGRADTVLDVEVTSNRPDAMNHLGLAREVAAILGLPLRPPTVALAEDPSPASEAAGVAVEAPDLCPRYVGRVVSGVRIGESPVWLRRRLEAVGLAPKNNIVDASNYVLLELGQPLHAFDLSRLAGRGVVVRRARSGERIVTVADREEKVLDEEMLVIAEAGEPGCPGRPAAIAGVMGGSDSAISGTTRDILIESAWFDPRSIRRTARRLGMRTDASHRFERGADPAITRFAADRLAALIVDLAGGKVLAGAIDVRSSGYGERLAFEDPSQARAGGTPPLVRTETPIVLELGRLVALLGIDVEPRDVPLILGRLGIAAEPRTTSFPPGSVTWLCRVPSWRRDLAREVDLIEEYARLAGYDRIPETLPAEARPIPRPDPGDLEDRARDLLVSFGYNEAIDYAMIPAADDARFGPLRPPEGKESHGPFVILNPLSDRWEVMRRSLLPGLARALAFNVARGRFDLRLFEVGTTHTRGPGGAPIETRVAAIGACGLVAEPAWPTPARVYDLLDLKGAAQVLVAHLRGHRSVLQPAGDAADRLAFVPQSDQALPEATNAATPGVGTKAAAGDAGSPWPFHPFQSFRIERAGRVIGRGGRLHPEVEAYLECARPLLLAEILLEPFAGGPRTPRYEPVPRLNPVERDLSFTVANELPYATVEAAVSSAAGALRAGDGPSPSFFLVDRFEGGPVPTGRVSYAFRFRFSPRDHALTAEELNGAIEAIAGSLARALRADIRSR